MMWSIRKGEIDEEGVNARIQLGGDEGVNVGTQLTVYPCAGNCIPREARSHGNTGENGPKQLTEADDYIGSGEDANSKSRIETSNGAPLKRGVLCPHEDRDEDGEEAARVDPSRSGFLNRIWALIGIARRRK